MALPRNTIDRNCHLGAGSCWGHRITTTARRDARCASGHRITTANCFTEMPPTTILKDVIGSRGESIVELCLTDYETFARPLFRPGFLGDKWPAIDYYVELTGVRNRRPYFLIQVKSTSSSLAPQDQNLKISSRKEDVVQLLQFPGPTYIFGVHEPPHRVFVKSVHTGVAKQGITRIQCANELTPANLQRLYDEVQGYWRATTHKPLTSVFT